VPFSPNKKNIYEKNKMMEEQTQIEKLTREDIVTTPEGMTCKVLNITIKKGKDIFVNKQGEIKTDKPNEDFYIITVKNDQHNFKTDYHMKLYKAKSVPDNSTLGKYLNRYGLFETGMEIFIVKNSKGYYDLQVK